MKVFALLSILEEHKNLTLEEKKLAEKKGSLIKAFWKLFKGYWCSEEKWKARGLFIIVILMNIAVVYIQVKLVYWNNDFFNIIGKRCFESFGPSVKEFLILIATFTLIATYLAYLIRFLHIKWRTWLTTRFIDNWMKDQAYYRIQVSGRHTDNQDQRICEDIDEFTDITIKLLSGDCKFNCVHCCVVEILRNVDFIAGRKFYRYSRLYDLVLSDLHSCREFFGAHYRTQTHIFKF